MSNLVEFAFTMIAYAIIATFFYAIFFGASFIHYNDGSSFDGLIFIMARGAENSMGYLYYEYVYEPTVHGTDNIDIELLNNCLGLSVLPNTVSVKIDDSTSSTKSDLSYSPIGTVNKDSFANVNFPSSDTLGVYYTSGWH